MLSHQFLAADSVLLVRPEAPLTVADFQQLSTEVDPFLKAHGSLAGVLLEGEAFRGWEDFKSLVAHLRFVKDHHRSVKRVAAVGDGAVLSILPHLAGVFVKAQVRHFSSNERQAALAWVKGDSATI